MKALIGVLIFIGIMAISWAVTVGLVYLICLCFSWNFSLLIATGIWLGIFLLKQLFTHK